MTCYLLPIENPEARYTLHVLRFNPETDEKPYWRSYQVPFVSTMTVIEALEYLWDQGEYIAFRTNCREFTCGSCAMLINGKPQLACDTILQDDMRLEPLSRYGVLRDLVVDTEAIKKKLKDVKYWPVSANREKNFTVPPQVIDAYGQIYSRCIECACCLEACPASFNEASRFDGPMYALLLARAANHPLDAMNRIQQASERGIWACVSCFECADVCPLDLSPAKEVAKFRRKAITQSLKRPFTFRKDKRYE
ncbi:MAG: succinate dehydrogenase/fumarate reductase iron-sulfur subunit [Desulfobacterales bacterium]|nr:MAG: succinate dehydrogenase/fumarate reductase iron-sulfur subunit [Desulfobacterales bacterium]